MLGSEPSGGGSNPSPEATHFEHVVQRGGEWPPPERQAAGSSPAAFITFTRRRSPMARGACLRNKRLGVRVPPSVCVLFTPGWRKWLTRRPEVSAGESPLAGSSPAPGIFRRAGVAQTGRRAVLKKRSLRVRVPPPASRRARVAQRVEAAGSNPAS
jgi:hypothetical protein